VPASDFTLPDAGEPWTLFDHLDASRAVIERVQVGDEESAISAGVHRGVADVIRGLPAGPKGMTVLVVHPHTTWR
jgi:hypothetical protein